MAGSDGWGPYGPQGPQGPYGQPGPYGPQNAHQGYVHYVPYVPPQPGVVPLKPLDLGDIFRGVFATLRRYMGALYLPLLAASGVVFALFAVYGVVAYNLLADLYGHVVDRDGHHMTPSDVGTLVGVLIAGGVLLLVTYTVLYAVSTVTSTVVLRHAVLGRAAGARKVWTESRPWLWRVIGVNALLALASTTVVAVLMLMVLFVAVAVSDAPALLVLFLLLPALWALELYVYVRLVLLVPAMVMEELPVRAAFRRAWRLNAGNWGRSFGIPFLMNLLGSLAVRLVLTPFSAIGMTMVFPDGITVGPGQEPNLPGAVALFTFVLIMIGLSLVGMLATLPLSPLTNGLLYVDRRIRNERLDIALGEAAGLWTTQPQPPAAQPPAEEPTDAPPTDAAPTDVQPPAGEADSGTDGTDSGPDAGTDSGTDGATAPKE